LAKSAWAENKVFALAPALVVAALALCSGAAAAYSPPSVGQMAVVFPPWVSEAQAIGTILAAGGRLVGPSRLPSIFIAYAPDSDFASRVRQRGALLLVAAEGLCSPAAPSAHRI